LVNEGLTSLSLYLYKEAKQNNVKFIIELDKTLEEIRVTDKMNVAVQEMLTEYGKSVLGLRNNKETEVKQ
jgi:hypothetical protein